MDRAPLPPPFPVGQRLRYVGSRRAWVLDAGGNEVPYLAPGLEVTVDKRKSGRRGTLRPLPGEWDEDEPPLDTTTDGYSVYHVDVAGREPFGRIIWPADAGEWEAL